MVGLLGNPVLMSCVLLPLLMHPQTRAAAAEGRRRAVAFPAVRFSDGFWARRQAVYRERTLPHSWQYVQREVEDNEIAAGWRQAERGEDTPWNQANLHKVLETCAYALAQEPNPDLTARVEGILRAVAAAQQPDGYCNALITARHMTPWANLDGQHDGYVAGHLIEAAVAHFQATGRREFLDVACRVADHIHRRFIVQGHTGVCGHAELELALVRLYRVTGEGRYLDLAREWIERRGRGGPHSSPTPRSYFMDHLPIRDVAEVTGHAVRTMFYSTGVAGVAGETGDAGLAEAARRLWCDTTRRKMYVTGSVGSQAEDEGFGPGYDLPNDGYCESCAACGLVYFAHEMFLLDGDGESLDVLERALYNAVLHGIALDGTTTYYRNPLTDARRSRDNCWVCCPPCLSRTLLRVQEFAYAQTDRDLYVGLYGAGGASVTLRGVPVALTQETDYPWEDEVRLQLQPARPVEFALRLRLPGWCDAPALTLNGKAATRWRREQDFAVLNRRWRPGDEVRLELPMPVERVAAHPAVEADRGLVALQRGPLVYAFEALDNEGTLDFALPADPQFGVERRDDLLGGLCVVTARSAAGHALQAIPFYALANRDLSEQRVWVPQLDGPDETAPWGDALYRPLDSARRPASPS